MALIHNENTILKVYESLEGVGIPREQAIDAVVSMQGKRIVFREATPDEPVEPVDAEVKPAQGYVKSWDQMQDDLYVPPPLPTFKDFLEDADKVFVSVQNVQVHYPENQQRVNKPSQILKYFSNRWHVTAESKAMGEMFASLAVTVDRSLPDGAEKSTTLRKLLEAQDAAIRACS